MRVSDRGVGRVPHLFAAAACALFLAADLGCSKTAASDNTAGRDSGPQRSDSTPAAPQKPARQLDSIPGYQITSIKAHLYHQATGTFDTTDIVADGRMLWDVIIGDIAQQRDPSGATLVLVGVAGNWLSGNHPPRLLVSVQKGGRQLLRQVASLNALFSEGRTIWVPFMAFDTGCDTTQITASLVTHDGSTGPAFTRSIDFQCGE